MISINILTLKYYFLNKSQLKYTAKKISHMLQIIIIMQKL